MSICYFCESEVRVSWSGYWCENCRVIKNLGNVYGFKEIKEVLERVCLRDGAQRNFKISRELKKEIELKAIGDKKEAKNC